MMDDREIIELFNMRDEDAIKEANYAYGKYCYTIAYNILSSHQDAEECINDTYLQAWRSIPPHQPNSLKFFLAEITRNLSLNRYKERKRKKRGGGEMILALDEISEFVAGTKEITDEIAEKELVNCINSFLRSLPQRNSNIFVMRYFHFYATKEIAKMYGLTEKNVLMILSRTRRKLRDYLEKEGYMTGIDYDKE